MKRLQERNTCIWCNQKLGLKSATWEHLIPKSLGGDNSQTNLELACLSCNQDRGNILIGTRMFYNFIARRTLFKAKERKELRRENKLLKRSYS